MDREQEEMQFLGVFGIYRKAYNIILSCRKIFNQITFSLILPLSFIYLAQMEVSSVLSGKIINNEGKLDEIKTGTPRYEKLSDVVSSERAYFWLIKAAYLTLFLIFSLLSTAAVVYTVTSVYTSREVTFKKVMNVVPKVWKRLVVTFLTIFIDFFAYACVATLAFTILIITCVGTGLITSPKVLYSISIVFVVLFFEGLLYMIIVWQLASVVSVLEEECGFKAMKKSRELIKGKMWTAMIIIFKLNLSSAAIRMAFEKLVVHGDGSLGLVSRGSYGAICLLLLTGLFLFGHVIQTVIYFVCKSYHQENIDKSALSDHLEVYQGGYVPLKSMDVQLEQYDIILVNGANINY